MIRRATQNEGNDSIPCHLKLFPLEREATLNQTGGEPASFSLLNGRYNFFAFTPSSRDFRMLYLKGKSLCFHHQNLWMIPQESLHSVLLFWVFCWGIEHTDPMMTGGSLNPPSLSILGLGLKIWLQFPLNLNGNLPLVFVPAAFCLIEIAFLLY